MVAGGIAFLFIAWLMSGCAVRGPMGDVCFLCDFVPSPATGVVLTAPIVVQVVPATRFNGLAVVSLGGGLHHLQGEIFQALQAGCGLTQVDAVDERSWETAPAHEYRVKIASSDAYRADGISMVSVSATLSSVSATIHQREYRFVRSGSGTAYHGGGYDSYGRPRYTGVYQSREEALRVAMRMAMVNFCGGGMQRGVVVVEPRLNPDLAVVPYSSGGVVIYGNPYGIQSHSPGVHRQRHKDGRKQRRSVPARRAPVYKGR